MLQENMLKGQEKSASPFFSFLMEKDERNCQSSHFSNGEYIFHKGERNDYVYLIQKGQVEVGHANAQHQWVDMGPYGMIDMEEELLESGWLKKAMLGEGECLGEVCCLNDSTHDLSARAVGDVHMLSVPGSLLKSLCNDNTNLTSCVREVVTQAQRKLESL